MKIRIERVLASMAVICWAAGRARACWSRAVLEDETDSLPQTAERTVARLRERDKSLVCMCKVLYNCTHGCYSLLQSLWGMRRACMSYINHILICLLLGAASGSWAARLAEVQDQTSLLF